MAALLPSVPVVATSINYPAGAFPWNGGPTKLTTLTSGFQTYGWTPDEPPGAQEFNLFAYSVCEVIKDQQIRSAPRVIKTLYADRCASLWAYLPILCQLVLPYQGTSVKFADRLFSDRSVQTVTPGGGVNTNSHKRGNYLAGTVSKVALMPHNAAGGAAALDVITEAVPPTHAYGTLPHAGALYTHACSDDDTGNFVAVAGNSVLGADVGFAYGDPAALTFVAVGTPTGWVADPYMSVVAKGSEIRAFGKAHTFVSQDGCATVSNLTDTDWNGGIPSGNMFPPCWDAKNERWIVGVAHLSTSAVVAAANSTLYTSQDGVTWDLLASAPTLTSILHIAEHTGVLYAIALNHTPYLLGAASYLEILYSFDGGSTWKRPGIDLSPSSSAPGFSLAAQSMYHHLCGWTKAGSYLIAQAGVSVPDLTSALPAVGEGVEVVILSVHGDDAESV